MSEKAGVGIDGRPLITRAEYKTMTPHEQGCWSYLQAAWPGSELTDDCPYAKDSNDEKEWRRGRWDAMQDCQELEE